MSELPNTDTYMTTPQVAIMTQIPESTWQKLRVTGGGPSYIKLGKRVVYSKSDIVEYMANHKATNTSSYSFQK